MAFPQHSVGAANLGAPNPALDPPTRLLLLENRIGILRQQLQLLKDVCRCLCRNDLTIAQGFNKLFGCFREPRWWRARLWGREVLWSQASRYNFGHVPTDQ